MSTFFFDDDYGESDEEARVNYKDRKNSFFVPSAAVAAAAEAYEVSNTLGTYTPQPGPNPVEQYQYHQYMRESQYQPLPPPKVRDPVTGQDVIISSRDFQVSLIGEDGPDEYLSVARAADRLTTIWEDAADIRYKLDAQYYTGQGGSYQPIQFGIPKYTGDAGYPVVDPNPGNCRPGFLKDQFGRCLHMSWFNLPMSPAGNPWTDISGNSVIQNGMNPLNGVCPPDMFLASNGKCYFFPAPPQQYPAPPPAAVSGQVSGTSNYGSAFYGTVPGSNSSKLYGKSPNGRVYNTPPAVNTVQSMYGTNTVFADYGPAAINQVRVEKQYLSPGDRAILHTNVTVYNNKGGVHLGVVVPDLNFKVATPDIPITYPGVMEEVETNFLIPLDTEPGDYIGEVQLVEGDKKLDSVNFVIAVD